MTLISLSTPMGVPYHFGQGRDKKILSDEIRTVIRYHWRDDIMSICISKSTEFNVIYQFLRIYASVNQVSIGSDNGLSPIRRQAIIWTNAVLLSIGPLGTHLSEILIKIQNFSLTKMHLKILSMKWRPFWPGGDELTGSEASGNTQCAARFVWDIIGFRQLQFRLLTVLSLALMTLHCFKQNLSHFQDNTWTIANLLSINKKIKLTINQLQSVVVIMQSNIR